MRKKQIMSGLLILVAIGVICISLNPRLYVGRWAQFLAGQTAKQNPQIVTGEADVPVQYDGVSDVNLKRLRADMRSKATVVLRGYIAIPQVGIDMPIFEGTSPKSLARGAGTLKPNAVMGQRNYTIGAHNLADNHTYFSPLQNEFKIGAKIYVTNGKMVYVYRSTAKRVVSEYQVDVLADHPTQLATITLMTCFEEPPYYTNATKRVVITGELVEKQPISATYLHRDKLFKALQK